MQQLTNQTVWCREDVGVAYSLQASGNRHPYSNEIKTPVRVYDTDTHMSLVTSVLQSTVVVATKIKTRTS